MCCPKKTGGALSVLPPFQGLHNIGTDDNNTLQTRAGFAGLELLSGFNGSRDLVRVNLCAGGDQVIDDRKVIHFATAMDRTPKRLT